MFERLTIRPDIGLDEIWFANSDDPEGAYTIHDIAEYGRCDVLDAIAERLAAYEDTGLTPDEVAELKAENARLQREIDLLNDVKVVSINGIAGQLEMQIEGEPAKLFLAMLIGTFEQNGAENYLTTTIDYKEHHYAVTIQNCDGTLTPEEKIGRLQRERDALLEDLRGDCASCVHRDAGVKSDVCQTCPRPGGAGFGNWEWRGPQEGITDEV